MVDEFPHDIHINILKFNDTLGDSYCLCDSGLLSLSSSVRLSST